MDDIDIALNMLAGHPIPIYNDDNKLICYFYPPTLKNIVDFGYKNFLYRTSFLIGAILQDIDNTITAYKGWTLLLSDEQNMIYMQTALSLFIKEIVVYDLKKEHIVIITEELKHTDKVITESVCNTLISLIKTSMWIANDLIISKTESESVKKLKEKIGKYKEKLRKESKDSDESLDISDIISIVISKNHGINFVSVWDLTYYALYTMFLREQINDAYDISVKSLLAGAKSEDVKLKSWLSKIDKGGT